MFRVNISQAEQLAELRKENARLRAEPDARPQKHRQQRKRLPCGCMKTSGFVCIHTCTREEFEAAEAKGGDDER